jgi:hypothetical protein
VASGVKAASEPRSRTSCRQRLRTLSAICYSRQACAGRRSPASMACTTFNLNSRVYVFLTIALLLAGETVYTKSEKHPFVVVRSECSPTIRAAYDWYLHRRGGSSLWFTPRLPRRLALRGETNGIEHKQTRGGRAPIKRRRSTLGLASSDPYLLRQALYMRGWWTRVNSCGLPSNSRASPRQYSPRQ